MVYNIIMPAGKKERFTIGARGTYGCKGYPVVGPTGNVHGCHTTRASARRQQSAMYASIGDSKKAQEILDIAKQEELSKARSVVENHPQCNGGFGVVGSDGELKSCHKSRAEAEAAIAAHHQQEGGSDNSNDSIGKFWSGTAFSFEK